MNRDELSFRRVLTMNLSPAQEQASQDKLAEAQAREWAEENRSAIQAYNEFVETNGCFGDEYRKY